MNSHNRLLLKLRIGRRIVAQRIMFQSLFDGPSRRLLFDGSIE
jgi:hypothetical protein